MEGMEKVKSIVEKVCKENGVDLVEMKFIHIPGRSRLEIFIDKLGGVNVEECKKVSEKVEFYLDLDPDLIKGRYFLIVSSPGVERPLKTKKDFMRKQGLEIDLFLKDGTTITGKIKGIDNEFLYLQGEESIKKVKWENIREGKQRVSI